MLPIDTGRFGHRAGIKLNLIFYNVPESQSSDRSAREAKDKESVKYH